VKSIKIVLTGLFLTLSVISNAQQITPNAKISLLTCSSGEELYSTFGHSAIRVKDTTTGQDIVFNYGVFDFDTPHFYWKFVRGKLMYQLAIQSTYRFIQVYNYEGRSVIEEQFNLTEKEKAQLINYLKKNYKPENRYYLYDFFYKNCSSIIWDVVKPRVDTKLNFDSTAYQPKTFRQMLYPSLEKMRWSKFGIDIALGLPADKTAGFVEQMFLPAYLSDNMSHTYRNNPANGSKKLLLEEKTLVKKNQDLNNSGLFTPSLVFCGIFLIFLVLTMIIPNSKITKTADYIFFSLQCLLGLLLLFLWFGTDHSAMNTNMNLLWANPIALILVFFMQKRKNKLKTAAVAFLIITSAAVLIGWNLLPQQFNPVFIPICLTIIIRCTDLLMQTTKDTTLSNSIRKIVG
jgi:hypothetical protein